MRKGHTLGFRVNHVRYENKINHSNEEFIKRNKNKLKRKYKNADITMTVF
jgi:hypothetical protein